MLLKIEARNKYSGTINGNKSFHAQLLLTLVQAEQHHACSGNRMPGNRLIQ
jgi:hypothetical protein